MLAPNGQSCGLHSQNYKPNMVMLASNSSFWKTREEGSEVQSDPQLLRKFQIDLQYLSPAFKN